MFKRIVISVAVIFMAAGCQPSPANPTPPGIGEGGPFVDLHDPTLPEVLIKEESGYRLDPTWEVESIGFVYQWWGLSPEPVFEYLQVERDGDTFRRGDEALKTESVQALIDAISRLHRSQAMLAGNRWTDDYPSWTVEITGADGQRMYLYSSSTGNVGSAPWNVLINGRLYAQYDGSIAEPLAALFPSEQGSPAAAFFPGGFEAENVYFASQGLPPQLVGGFTGLLPIADSFGYTADLDAKTIEGGFVGRSSIAGVGLMVIGTIDRLNRVTLDAQPCTFEEAETGGDPAGAAWHFTCPAQHAADGESYRLPIEMVLGTDRGEALTIGGELFGVWGKIGSAVYLPPFEELEAALSQNPAAQELLADNAISYANFTAAVNPDDLSDSSYSGELVLMGETEVSGQPVTYTAAFQFAIKAGKLTRWDLERAELDRMLATITSLPISQRAVEADPDVTLNLWYAELPDQQPEPAGTPEPQIYLINSSFRRYAARVSRCQQVKAHEFPRADAPLEAFGFNSTPTFWMPDFLLIDGQAVVGELDLSPGRFSRGPVEDVLIPAALDTGDLPPFSRIWIQAGGSMFSNGGAPIVELWLPDDVSASDQKAYRAVAEKVGRPVSDGLTDTIWEINNSAAIVMPDGSLEIQSCK